jgi:hypothetical protein
VTVFITPRDQARIDLGAGFGRQLATTGIRTRGIDIKVGAKRHPSYEQCRWSNYGAIYVESPYYQGAPANAAAQNFALTKKSRNRIASYVERGPNRAYPVNTDTH